jgi:hypothetical protein
LTDWDVFREACLALLSGNNPYLVGVGEMRFYNPVWTLVPILPFSFLPPLTGLFLNALISIAVLMAVTRKLEMSIWEFFWVVISPMHLQSMLYGNIEWVPLLGILFPAPLAMVFFTTKPQATFGLILLTLLTQWRKESWKGLFLALAPTVVLFAVSLWLWGFPPVPGIHNPGLRSLFPYSLIVGLPALLLSLKRSDVRLAAFVGPFVSPYVTFHGYLPALFPFKGKWMALAVLVAFIPVLLGIVA